MAQPIITVEGVGKSYRLGAKQENYPTFREAILGTILAPWNRLRQLRDPVDGENCFWALKDLNFEVHRGQVTAIIGRNGAGKSTLLKILSRITEPTEGRAILRGRVASLLEVGTGFHPELSGRENVYLNGSILGMRKSEIDRKFDAIVAFSEVEKFLDTPVKRYSSGMYVRLAFAVAAHLEPEILIVDEVLAVGDAEFQRKCLGKMQEVATGEGRTVLFVSHNMSAVQQLCPRAILLRQGRLVEDGDSADVVREYLSYLTTGAKTAFDQNPERSGDGRLRLQSARVLNDANEPADHLVAGRPATIEMFYTNPAAAKRATFTMTLHNHLGIPTTHFSTELCGPTMDLQSTGRILCRIPNLPLPIGQYRVALSIWADRQLADSIPNALVFEISSSVFFESHASPPVNYCTCLVDHRWEHHAASDKSFDPLCQEPHARRD